jgi:hypothetical protein
MSPVRVGEQARRQARRDAQFLIHLAQTDLAGSPEAATSIVERAVACEWWDVALLAEYAGVVAVTSGGDASGLGRAVDAVGTWAERCGDAASLALFHALRARAAAFLSDEVVSPATDNDLATASVLLERREGGAVERVTAHVECALLFGRRRFWELEAAQYDLALAVDVLAEDPGLDRRELQVVGARWAIANNLAEAGGHRMSGRYLIGDAAGLCHAAVDARRVIAEAVASGLPEAWLPEIDAVAVLVDALTGLDVVEAAVEVGERLEPGTPFEGMALLAGARWRPARRRWSKPPSNASPVRTWEWSTSWRSSSPSSSTLTGPGRSRRGSVWPATITGGTGTSGSPTSTRWRRSWRRPAPRPSGPASSGTPASTS